MEERHSTIGSGETPHHTPHHTKTTMTTTTSSSSSSSSFCLERRTQHEEWLLRYQQVQDAALQKHESNETTENNNHKSQWLLTQSIVTRAGRLGALQCAALDNSSNNKMIHSYLATTQAALDQDTQVTCTQLLQHVVVSKVISQNISDPAAVDSTPSSKEEEEMVIDLDAFFDDYPECRRKDHHCCGSDSDDDGYDSSSDEDKPKKVATTTRGTMTTVPYPPPLHNSNRPQQSQTQSQSQSHPYPQSQAQPQQNHRPASSSSGAFSYTPPDDPSSGGRQSQTTTQNLKNQQQQQQQRPPSYSNHNPVQNPYATSSTSSRAANHHNHHGRYNHNHNHNNTSMKNHHPNHQASWDDHVQQQNPFQTAREFAQAGGNDDEQAQNQQNHYTAQTTTSYSTNPYHNNNAPQPPQPEESLQPGGPHIPDSLKRKFQPPTKRNSTTTTTSSNKPGAAVKTAMTKGGVKPKSSSQSSQSQSNNNNDKDEDEEALPEELQHLEKELVEKIQNDIMETGDKITFDDIAGLHDAKQTVQEVVCWPMKRPDLFTGLRRAPNGLLLYGPPGTGKTLIGKAIAHESGATFFSISSSSLTSKWIGEGEKLVKTLFAVAAYREPAVVFLDEIDSLLTQRKSSENEASRRIKTEFLVQLDGTGTSGQGRVLVIGATNRPQELDEAARRRFTKRLYIPLPTASDRNTLLHVLLQTNHHQLTPTEIERLAQDTDGFSGADLKALCTDAAMGPIRQLQKKCNKEMALERLNAQDIPPISWKHFKRSLKGMKPSVAPSDLVQYEEWDRTYGSKRADDDDDDDDDESDSDED